MISIAQAFRVWKRLLAQRDYPFPPEAKWLCIGLVIGVVFGPAIVAFGIGLGITAFTTHWTALSDTTFDVDLLPLLWWLPGLAWVVASFYVLAVVRFWSDRGIDRWINEGRLCRTCGAEGRPASVDRYALIMRFRDDRKEYDRRRRAERRGRHGHIVEGA